MQLLQSKYKDILNTKRVTSHALPRIVEYLFANPIITISRTAKELKLDYHSVQNAIKTLMGMEILKKVNVNKRCGKLFVAHEILQILS